jgi:hypothetical protein
VTQDPRILAENPLLTSRLPDANITVVVRGDSSGSTNLFTSALVSFSPEFSTKAGGKGLDTMPGGFVFGFGNWLCCFSTHTLIFCNY